MYRESFLATKQLDVERAEVLQAIKGLKSIADRETAPTQGSCHRSIVVLAFEDQHQEEMTCLTLLG